MKKEYLFALGGAAAGVLLCNLLRPRNMELTDEAEGFVNKWIDSVCEGNPETITSLYAENGTLIGTIAEEIKIGRDAIRTYFDSFTLKEPCGVLNSININSSGDIAIADGTYTFNFGDGTEDVKARFSFVLKKIKGKFEILTHHSSAEPI